MFFLGLDFGTSGARACLIDTQHNILWSTNMRWRTTPPNWSDWHLVLFDLLQRVPSAYRADLAAITIDGTSGTILFTDTQCQAVTPVLYYNHPLSAQPIQKLAWLRQHDQPQHARHLMHQVDYCNSLLLGFAPASDYHNALKSGFNPITLEWEADLFKASDISLLPRIVPPGSTLGHLRAELAKKWAYSPQCEIRAGTTDSIAAFIAATHNSPTRAVTSLGSSLVIKLLSDCPINSPEHGIYSHKFGSQWLTGGASNTGGAVLKYYFSETELEQLSQKIHAEIPSRYDYYPLLQAGERFPIYDPQLAPRLTPRPADPIEWLHGLLEGMAVIEQQGYAKLCALGATPPTQIFTSGGGSRNLAWQRIRQRRLGIPVIPSPYTDAAFGSALLAAGVLC